MPGLLTPEKEVADTVKPPDPPTPVDPFGGEMMVGVATDGGLGDGCPSEIAVHTPSVDHVY